MNSSALATLFLFAVIGLTLRAALAPLILLLTLLNIGYALSLFELIRPDARRRSGFWCRCSCR